MTVDAISLNIRAVTAKADTTPATVTPVTDSGNSLPAAGNTAPVQASPAPQAPQVDVEQIDIEQVVRQIQDFLAETERSLQFRVDEGSGRTVISVYSGSGELIRQIPSEELLEIAAKIQQQGFNLIDQRA